MTELNLKIDKLVTEIKEVQTVINSLKISKNNGTKPTSPKPPSKDVLASHESSRTATDDEDTEATTNPAPETFSDSVASVEEFIVEDGDQTAPLN